MQLLKRETIFPFSEKVSATCKRSYKITLGILRSQIVFYATEGKTACVIKSSLKVVLFLWKIRTFENTGLLLI